MINNIYKTPNGLITAQYESKCLVSLKDNNGYEVSLSKLWIKDMPAEHLNLFQSTVMPLNNCVDAQKVGDFYELNFKDWSWWHKSITDKTPIKININKKKKESSVLFDSIEAPPFLTILGLKVWIDKRLKNDINKCILSLGEEELDNEHALSDFVLKSGDTIEFRFIKKVLLTNEESGYGSLYHSTEFFKKYFLTMQSKMGAVCQIIAYINGIDSGYGTGFLIGRDLIMTNEHVLAERGKNAHGEPIRYDLEKNPHSVNNDKAVFFYEGTNQGIPIPLVKVIYVSKSPGRGLVTQKTLDFCIVKFDKSDIKGANLKKIQKLENAAADFFKNPPKNYNYQFATIIQHPIEINASNSESKQIAFRGNEIIDKRSFEIHFKTKTKVGSSGSPVLNDQGNLMGIHRANCNLIEILLNKNFIALKEELQKIFNSNHTFTIAPKSGGIFEWEINDKKDKTGLIELLTHISDNFEGLIEKNNVKQWAVQFLKDHDKALPNNLEEHISCKTATLASKIFLEIDNNKDIKKIIEESQEQQPTDNSNSLRNSIILICGIAAACICIYKSRLRRYFS